MGGGPVSPTTVDVWPMPIGPENAGMFPRPWRLLSLTVPVLAVVLMSWEGRGQAPARAPEPIPDAPRFVGTGSCAATACHGGRREPLGLKGSEYSFWAEFDPHRRAYEGLFGERSKQIERNYRRLAAGEDPTPERDVTCLSCHVHTGIAPREVEREAPILADGVGCESCHGPASRWLVAHTERPWRRLTDGQKAEWFGMTPAKDLATRARLCADCHLGTRAADVNHDLIAAGHPRLLYEFANQQSKHPRHWSLDDDKARYPDYEARAWALGTVISAERSLALLESRAGNAKDAHDPRPWPELAEYDCFACHREAKPAPGGPRVPGGSLPWGDWTFPALRRLARSDDGLFAEGSALARLPVVMSNPRVDADEAARLARLGAAELAPLERRILREPYREGDVSALLADVLREPASAPSWTDASRDYIALVSLFRARHDLGGAPFDGPTVGRLAALGAMLDLPRFRRADGLLFDSPVAYDPGRYLIDLQLLRDGAGRRGD
jgi:hypothetical protein